MAPVHTVPPVRIIVVLLVVLTALALGVTSGFAGRPEGAEISSGDPVSLATPRFLHVGKRYAFTWPGGGPPQTYTVKSRSNDGWILVEIAQDNTDPAFYVPGQLPTMWLHVGLAISIQEMRPLPY